MTPNDHDTDQGPATAASDKVLDHTRLQLSALIDGELPLDEARFLLRRLDHDADLRGCWERWQLCGDVLGGRVGVYARDSLSTRVTVAVAAESTATRAPVPGDRRWWRLGGGAALAASVAMIALFLSRQSPDVRVPTGMPAQVASNPSPAVIQPPVTPVAQPPAPTAPRRAAEVASALAVADAPRRLAARRSRGQSQRAALRSPVRVEAPVAVAAATPFGTPATAVDPFSGQHVKVATRPWPRALLPGASGNGAFTVDYGNRTDARTYSPFVPRSTAHSLPVAPAEDTDSDAPAP
jgi:negative regulator of sigma E activity